MAATLLTDEGFRKFSVCQRSKSRQDILREQLSEFDVDVKGPEEIQKEYEQQRHVNNFGYDVILDATGNPEAIERAVSYLRPGGKLVVYGCCPSGSRIQISAFDIMVKELTIVGSLIQPNTFGRAVDKIASLERKGRLNFDVLKTELFTLEEYPEALRKLRSREVMKTIVVSNDTYQNP